MSSAVIVTCLWVWTIAAGSWLPGFNQFGLHECSPFKIRYQTEVDFQRLSGVWYLIGRQDVGNVSLKLWNVQVNIIFQQWPENRKLLPNWNTHPFGCCHLQLKYFGRYTNGTCQGRIFSWGSNPAPFEGYFKRKLSGVQFSLLYIIGTDYNNFAVLAHCNSVRVMRQFQCAIFNLLLLMRQKPDNFEALFRFNISDTSAVLREACKGNVLLEPAGYGDASKSQSSVTEF